MKVKVFYADDAIERLDPEQWVNIFELMSGCFYCESQIKNLPEEVMDDPESYFVEPITEDGEVIPLDRLKVKPKDKAKTTAN